MKEYPKAICYKCRTEYNMDKFRPIKGHKEPFNCPSCFAERSCFVPGFAYYQPRGQIGIQGSYMFNLKPQKHHYLRISFIRYNWALIKYWFKRIFRIADISHTTPEFTDERYEYIINKDGWVECNIELPYQRENEKNL